MTSSPRLYHTLSTPVPGDPLTVAVRLAMRAADTPHVLYERHGTWSVAVGAAAELTVTPAEVRLSAPDGERTAPWEGHPGPVVRQLLAGLPFEDWRAYGTAAFELAYAGTPSLAELPGDQVLLRLIVPAVETRITDGTAVIRALDPEAAERTAAALDPTAIEVGRTVPVDLAGEDSELYLKAVSSAAQEIREGRDGSPRKVILSRSVPVREPVDIARTYLLGRSRNTPARSFLLGLDGLRAAGFSPEIVLAVDPGGRVRTQPLAGTRALTGEAGEDDRLRRELLADPKEFYEHAVTVRTSFGELADICVPGSVAVHDYMSVKPRGTAQHLASELAGTLAPGRDGWDALASLFPAVTVSGVPKSAANVCIRRLERDPRGLYGGAVLTVDQDGSFDVALVLRSVYQRGERTWLRAGAGIVGQSLPEREFTETCEKLRSVSLSVVAAQAPGADAAAPDRADRDTGLSVERMRADIAEALRCPVELVDDERSLIAQGLDSVGLMTVASKWSAFGVRLKVADLALEPTLAAWGELVRAQRDGGTPRSAV
ncbi:salicylate synthase [Streptomyces uncialis]|uniref:salicylate synthase n=1 Tax=Streptomyces uncialis TaxID=1048205 RepID=UPI00093F9F8E|nr:salicylate synthase [Streptomyces uncialis]